MINKLNKKDIEDHNAFSLKTEISLNSWEAHKKNCPICNRNLNLGPRNWPTFSDGIPEMPIEPIPAKHDQNKLRMDLIPPSTFTALAEVLTMGANKYGANSWQNLPDFNNRYYGALLRHLIAWRSGELLDKESGLSHLKHALANIVFLIDQSDKNSI